MPRTGRPKVDDSKDNRVTIRFSDEEIEKLMAYAEKYHLKKAQVLMKGFELLLKQEENFGKK